MRTRLPFFAALTFFVCSYIAVFAQGGRESKVSLRSNARLGKTHMEGESEVMGKSTLAKTSIGQRFPFIERFNYNGNEVTDSLWTVPRDVKKQNRSAVFNAQNINGVTYRSGDNSFGETDVLISNDIDVRGSNGQLFVSLAYSTGSTWQNTDSLVLEVETPSGDYQTVWVSAAVARTYAEIIPVTLDFNLFNSASLTLRFKSYSSASATNTETFLVHWVVLSDKIDLPYYENFTTDTAITPPIVFWQQGQTLVDDSVASLNSSSRVVVFDSKDERGTVYNNGGYADTLRSQPINISKFLATDSVYLRFYYKAMPAADNTDSLILEFFNNLGNWVRIWQTGSSAQSGFVSFSQQINLGRYRHANFQYRLINKCNYSPTDTLQFIATGFNIGRRLLIPFIDDFSASQTYPSTKFWTDRHVFINNDFAILSPSVNVATFDGLDERGNAYGQGNGYLDTLTCVPLKLNTLVKTDSVYLSFYIEPQGLGDKPNDPDSLVLEFRSLNTDPSAWQTVWNASAANYPVNKFTQVFIFIDSAFLHDDFQFRFKNIGSRTGSLDQWHVDYVRIDKGRRPSDTYYLDYAITGVPPSLLKKYYSMPRRHYDVNPPKYTNTQQNLTIFNNSADPRPLNYWRSIYDPTDNRIDTCPDVSGNVLAGSDSTVKVKCIAALPTASTADSIIFTSKYGVRQASSFDNIPTNDSVSVRTIFSNYFAYDDGTAEAGYGIEIEPGGVALGYELEVADSLYGLSMFFNQSFTDVSTQSFNLMVWSAIGTSGNGQGETVLRRILQSRPTYKNTINGFYYLEFDQPLYLPAGQFYIGWEQTTAFQLNMGFDQNYKIDGASAKNPDMWFRLQDGIWQKTKYEGALMMRPIVGKWLNPPVGVKETKAEQHFDAVVYPNPASSVLYFQLESREAVFVELFDLAGKNILAQTVSQNQLSLPALTEGLYLLKVTEQSTGNTVVKKIIIKQ